MSEDPHRGHEPEAASAPVGEGPGPETDRAAAVGSAGRKALDLFVFAPAGLLVTAVEELPELIEKGRSRFEMHVRNARFVGQMVVTTGQAHLRDRAGQLAGRRGPSAPTGTPGTPPDRADVSPVSTGSPVPPVSTVSTVSPVSPVSTEMRVSPGTNGEADPAAGQPRTGERVQAPELPSGFGGSPDATGAAGTAAAGEPSEVDWAIPGYDTLSASHVVRRLDGLGVQELETVRRYESQNRGRRTILHRVQQLLGAEEQPGQSGAPG